MRPTRQSLSSTAKTWDGKLTFANSKSTTPITVTIAMAKIKQLGLMQTTHKLLLKLIQKLTLTKLLTTRPRISAKPVERNSRKRSRKHRTGRRNTRQLMKFQTPSFLSLTISETLMASISPTHFATKVLVDLATPCLSPR